MQRFAILGMAVAATACTMNEAPGLSPTEEARLAETLEGRVAGEPQSCVQMREVRGNRSIGESVIVFEGRGDTIYINRPTAGCPSLDFGRALLIRTPTTQLCEGEIATVFDPVSGVEFGGCALGEFVPYREVR